MENNRPPGASRSDVRSVDSVSGLRSSFRALNTWTMLALSRFVLSIFALLIVFFGLAQPAHDADLAYTVLWAFVVYSGVFAAVSMRFPPNGPTAFLSHAVDIAFFSLLMHLTGGPTSPLCVYFTFVLFSATLRWSWRGGLITTAITTAIFVVMAGFDDVGFTGQLVHIVYLVVAGGLFSYFGLISERIRQRFAKLATPPSGSVSRTRYPPLEPIIAHAAEVMNFPRLLVTWQNEYEPHAHSASFVNGVVSFATTQSELIRLGEDIGSARFLDQNTNLPPRLADLVRAEKIHYAVIVPIRGMTASGYILFIDNQRLGEDMLPLATIAALHVSAEIEQHNQRLRMAETSATQERVRLARDLHDNLLQALAAASFQLKALEARVPQPHTQQLAEIRKLVTDQQNRLRNFVLKARGDKHPPAAFVLLTEITTLLQEIETQWKCRTLLSVYPPETVVSQDRGEELSMFITEAIANGVRHGGADEFEINFLANERTLTLGVRDNGSGLSGVSGALSHETIFAEELGSASLRQRASDLGSRMEMTSSPQGLHIVIEVPLN